MIGAGGVLGRLICHELEQIIVEPIQLMVTDYKKERAELLLQQFESVSEWRYLDVHNQEQVSDVVRGVELVIVTVKQQQPFIQQACFDQEIVCIDVTPFYPFVKQVQQLATSYATPLTGSVVMTGFIPGLSGLMINDLGHAFTEINEINVALLQNTNAKVGITGVLDMLNIIAQPVIRNGQQIKGFTKSRLMGFGESGLSRKVRLIEHDEKQLLQQLEKWSGVELYYWTAWNRPFYNAIITIVQRLGLLQKVGRFARLLEKGVSHNPEKSETAYLTVEITGNIAGQVVTKTLRLETRSDYALTAKVTAAIAKHLLGNKISGVVAISEVTELSHLLAMIKSESIKLSL